VIHEPELAEGDEEEGAPCPEVVAAEIKNHRDVRLDVDELRGGGGDGDGLRSKGVGAGGGARARHGGGGGKEENGERKQWRRTEGRLIP